MLPYWLGLCGVLSTCGFEVTMKDGRLDKKDLDEMKRMIEDISMSFDYNHNATADCIEVISKAVKHIGRRLEMLEDHVYNEMDDMDEDDNYLN
jgi:hypothetical protein